MVIYLENVVWSAWIFKTTKFHQIWGVASKGPLQKVRENS
jgi:hypothetical protein